MISNSKAQQVSISQIAEHILGKKDLKVNKSKTEFTTLHRGTKDSETWRNVKKVGSLLGDQQDIARRKQLAIAAMRTMNNVWLRGHTATSRKTRLKLFDSLVIHTLLYNSSCWGLRKVDIELLNSFHRQLLRRVCHIYWPHRISRKKLYRITNTRPISIRITQYRWRYLGHALLLPDDSPPKRAMFWCFVNEPQYKRAKGRQRETIVTTIQRDIEITKDCFDTFQLSSLEDLEDYIIIKTLAQNRKVWNIIVKAVVAAAEAKISSCA